MLGSVTHTVHTVMPLHTLPSRLASCAAEEARQLGVCLGLGLAVLVHDNVLGCGRCLIRLAAARSAAADLQVLGAFRIAIAARCIANDDASAVVVSIVSIGARGVA